MQIWEEILNDKKILSIYEQINKTHNYVISHGLLHMNNVVKYIEQICEIFKVDDKTKELAKIAGVLHDVGYMNGREEHEVASCEFAKNYLIGKLPEEEIEIVADAIEHHNRERFDYTSTNDVAWILFMADKMDYTRDRYIENLIDDEAKQKYSYYIKKIYLTRKNDLVFVNFEFYKNKLEGFYDGIDYLYSIYKTVIQHFNCTGEIQFHNA